MLTTDLTRSGWQAVRRAAVVGIFAGVSTAVCADQPLWEVGMGLAAMRLPHYRGSNQTHDWLLPLPFAVYRGEIFRADREGARARLVEADRFDLDLSFAASAPTRSKDNLARIGMPDLAPTVEVGPNLIVLLGRGTGLGLPWKVELRVPVRAAITLQSRPHTIGWIATPNVNIDMKVMDWNVGLFTGPIIGNRGLNGYFYDVAPTYATAARAAYRAEAGWGGWQTTAGVSKRSGNLWVGAFVKADSVARARYAASPLVRQQNTAAIGVAVSWVFAQSSQRVSGED